MRRHFLFIIAICLSVLCIVLPAVGQDGTTEPPTTGRLYESMMFPVSIEPAIYLNPFDVNDIEVVGLFIAPDDTVATAWGYWWQPYNLEAEQPAGTPLWQVNFTPGQVGDWTYVIEIRDDGVVVNTIEGGFTVEPSDNSGFIRVGANGHYFQFQDGQSYFPIGHNLNWSWSGGGDVWVYERWFNDLHANGGNFARLIIDVPWFIGLDWERPVGDYRTAQAAAARLDLILEMAAERGIYVQVVLLWSQTLRFYNSPPVLIPESPLRPDTSADWDNSPYNVQNGGPLNGPSVFFEDSVVRELFQRRLRYILARWTHHPNVFAWEVIDEIDRTVNYDPAIATAWLDDQIAFIREHDPYDHLITAGSRMFDPAIMRDETLDFTISQYYQRRPVEDETDQVRGVIETIRRSQQANQTPTMLINFSLNPWFEPVADDPDGIHIQNTLWATTLSGAAGSAMSDWWDTYIIPQGLSRYYAPLAAFTAGVDWSGLNLRPAEAALISFDAALYASVRVADYARQFQVVPVEEVGIVTVTTDGVYPSSETLSSYLYGEVYSANFRQQHVYQVTIPIDTQVEVRVRAVSTNFPARLQITVDDVVVSEVDLSAGSRNISVRVPLSAGEHHIGLDNTGDDWLELEFVEIGHLVAPVRALTLRDVRAGVVLAWLHHRDYTWQSVAAGIEPQPYTFRYQLEHMLPGRYVAEVFNPNTGTVLGQDILFVGDDGVLMLDLLPIDSHLALRIVGEVESVPDTPTPFFTDTPQPIVTEMPSPTPAATDSSVTIETPMPLQINTNTPRPSPDGDGS